MWGKSREEKERTRMRETGNSGWERKYLNSRDNNITFCRLQSVKKSSEYYGDYNIPWKDKIKIGTNR